MFRYKYGHKKSYLRSQYAGKIVPSLDNMYSGVRVVLFQKGTESSTSPRGGWWEHGVVLYSAQEQRMIVSTYDAHYDQTDWEIYVDTRNKHYRKLIKELKL